ncbi:MAG: SPFH domain-containing protein [Verrucomicrobiota bacterium]|jgi:membrane protease subunit (stomatin/prohibitin family)
MEAIKFDGTAHPWLIYKWPKTKIITGSQLIVRQGQEVVFFKNGLPLDTLGPGTHSLTANSLPLLQRISKLQSNNQLSIAAEIYFVNKIARLDLIWSTNNLLQVFEPRFQTIVRIASYGRMGMHIDNTQLFLSQMGDILPNDPIENSDYVEKNLKELILENVKNGLANFIVNQKTALADINGKNTALTSFIQQAVICKFKRFGIDVLNFSIESIRIFEEDIEKLRDVLHSNAEFETLGS